MDKLIGLQWLRAFSVIIVALYHFYPSVVPYGYLGVDVFFVLSGFFVAKMLDGIRRNETKSFAIFRTFLIRRSIRLLPALIVMMAITMPLVVVTQSPVDFIDIISEYVSALLFYSNYAYLAQVGYFDSIAESKALLHTWSLSLEMQFYVIYAIMIVIFFKVGL